MGILVNLIQTIIAKLFGGNSSQFINIISGMLNNKNGGGLAAIAAGENAKGQG